MDHDGCSIAMFDLRFVPHPKCPHLHFLHIFSLLRMRKHLWLFSRGVQEMRCKVCASDVNVLACVSWHGHGSSFCTPKKNGLVPTVFTMLKNILHPGLCHPSYTFQVPPQIWHEAFSGFLNPIFSVMPQDDKTVGCLGAPMPNWWLWLWLVSSLSHWWNQVSC
jgi:hypothetical protein